MLLYHGTKAEVAVKALTEGLKPRSITKTSNWDHTVASHKDCVYLTDTYPLYFAVNSHSGKESPGTVGIVELDTTNLNFLDLYPDEDVLEQAGRGTDDIKGNMEGRTRWYRKRLFEYPNVWLKSLDLMGTCAHKGIIPPSAITRIALIDYKKQAALCFMALDASISLMNYRFMKEKYKRMVQVIFNPEQITEYTDYEKFSKMDEALEYFKANRDGIEIINREVIRNG